MSTTQISLDDVAAGEALDRARERIDPALRAAVRTLPENMRHIAGYHFGWTDEHGQPVDAGRGKALRPALVLLSARAVAGTATAAVPAAVAVELVHNFSLIHDDVMDQDSTRRHRPTAWNVFGVNAAILAGDALVSLASEILAGSDHPAAARGVQCLNAAVQDLIDGQIMDLAFEQRDDVTVAECQRMANAKTAALLGTSCELGALFADATTEQAAHLRDFGEQLGLAFQHTDDLLGIWGDPATTGKPVFSDLRNRKKTLPVVAALTSDTAAGRTFAARYRGQPPVTETELEEAAQLVDAAGGRSWSSEQADALLDSALDHIEAVAGDGRTSTLKRLARLATHRDQ